MSLSAIRPQLAEIPIGLIDEPRLMSRNRVDDAHVEQLVTSIRLQGFTSAIVVALVNERYEVIAGHHRLLAARRAGVVAVPALIYPSYLDGIEAIQHAENADRKPAGPCDEAVWFSELLEKYADQGTDGLAARVGRTRNYVEGRLSLLHGDLEIFKALGEDKIAIGVALQLNRCMDEAHRRMLLHQAVEGGATVGLVTQWITEWKTIHQPAAAGLAPIAPVSAGGAVLSNEYFRCRVCGERDNTANMQPVNVHDYCLRALIDPTTGIFRSRADYLEFPTTREAALALLQRVLLRFPELADDSAA